MMCSRLKFFLLLVCMGGCLISCVSAPPNSGFSNFSSYAESVFRHQNAISSRLLMLHDADMIDDDEIEQAEDDMSTSCYLLNEYAERENSNQSISLQFKTKVQDSIKGCDASLHRLEAMLNSKNLHP